MSTIIAADWNMLSIDGNNRVNDIVINAKDKGLTWPEVYKDLWLLHKLPGFILAMDPEVTRTVYSYLKFNTPFYFYGLSINGKTLFNIFPELEHENQF